MPLISFGEGNLCALLSAWASLFSEHAFAVYPIVTQAVGAQARVVPARDWGHDLPAILTASIALWRLWLAEGGKRPDFVAGHSLGEYSALVAADCLSLADAVKLVERRGQLMQEAVPAGQGAMAAILGLDDAVVLQACADAAQGDVVSAVNFNSPGQVVIAGAKAAVERAMALCKEAGAKRALPLPVSVRFSGDYVAELASLNGSKLPVVRLEPLMIGGIYPKNLEDRILIKLDQVPPYLLETLVAVEDRDFYSHWGVSPKSPASASG